MDIEERRKPSQALNEIPPGDMEDRFWEYVSMKEEKDCWEWMGTIRSTGYGIFHHGNIRFQAHRVAWVISNGPVATELDVCHICDNRSCVNPDHLFVGTRKENMRDAINKGRMTFQTNPEIVRRGVDHSMAKLTEDQVRAIRLVCIPNHRLFNCKNVARLCNIDKSVVADIVAGRLWKSVK